MVNPGSFLGSRKTFLTTQKPAYAEAVKNNYAGDFILGLQRRYLKRYPMSLDHKAEPSAEFLAAVDDNAADEDEDLSGLSAEGRKARGDAIIFRKDVCSTTLF